MPLPRFSPPLDSFHKPWVALICFERLPRQWLLAGSCSLLAFALGCSPSEHGSDQKGQPQPPPIQPHTGGGTWSAGESCPTLEEETFSFFLLSHAAIVRESHNPDGFGGNLGGLAGADAICQRVAEYVSPCQSAKHWRAFLSSSTVNAIDRIGNGPFRDRRGRLVAATSADLVHDRPVGADPVIRDDLPNEEGVPNRNPDGTGAVDNHQILTGTGTDGRLYSPNFAVGGASANACRDGWSIAKATCWDWTSAEPDGCPRVGHSWPRSVSGINWMSVWNEGGCAPGGVLTDVGGPDGSRRVGSAGGYGGWYCFAVTL